MNGIKEKTMPSYCIHLAIGNLYKKKNKIVDEASFDAGIIAPDFAKDKELSHYSAKGRKSLSLPEFLAKKVELDKYLEVNNIDSDFKRGEFLHLVTDYIYFTQFFSREQMERLGDEFMPTMYYSYDRIKEYVEEKYNVVYPGDLATVLNAIEEKRKLLGFDKGVTKENILPMKKLDSFIEFCSNIHLEQFRDKIINIKGNIVPDEGFFC